MRDKEIIQELNTIFKEILEIDQIYLSSDTTARDVDDWDSLNHIQLVVAIEKKFKIRFNSFEIQNWKNIGEMVQSISGKL